MARSTTAAHLHQRVTAATGTTSHTRREDLSTTLTRGVAAGMAKVTHMVVQVASTMVAQQKTRTVVTIAPQEALVADGKPQKDLCI